MLRILSFALAVTLLVSCDKNESESTTYELGTAFTMHVGDTRLCNCDAPAITLDSIVSDSRCPDGAQCIWEGEATVQLQMGEETLLLSTHVWQEGAQTTDTLGNFIYTLVEVLPYPTVNVPIPVADYEVELRVEAL